MYKYLTLAFSFIIISSYSQHLSWQQNISYGENNTAQAVVNDIYGHIYVAGSFSSGGHGEPYTRGVFINKYDTSGDLLWFDTIMSEGIALNSCIEYNGDLYLIGKCMGSNQVLNFGPFVLNTPSTYTHSSLFLAKYDITGNVLKAEIHPDINPIQAKIYDNNLYVCGSYTSCGLASLKSFDLNFQELSSICFGSFPGPILDMEVADENIYFCIGGGSSSTHALRKYSSTGALKWNKPTLGTNYDIAANSSDDCFVAGYNGSGGRVAKFDSMGNMVADYYPPGLSLVTKVYYNNSDQYIAGTNSTNQLSLLKTKNDTLKYDYVIGNYTPLDISKFSSNIYMTIKGNDMYGAAYVIKVSEEEELTTGVVELESISSLSIYPNPSPSTFNISYNAISKEDLQLNVINSKGQVIFTENKSKFQGEYRKEIDLSNYARGVYSIEIIQGKEKLVKKVVVN